MNRIGGAMFISLRMGVEPCPVTSHVLKSSHQALIRMYLAYRPRDSFEGLPPIEDEACVEWVRKMIRDGTNLVALASEGDIVGHTAIFFIDRQRCEMLTVAWPQFQSRGIGTELVRSSIHLAREMGFEKVWLSVDAANLRARHIYRECGFECLSSGDGGDVEMALDLKGQHEELYWPQETGPRL